MSGDNMTEHEVMEFFELEAELLANGNIPVKKYRHKESSLNVFFVNVDSQVINGYFCYGIDQPEGTGIETLLWHLDSSGGLLPRPMRGDMLRPSWQFHGAENPLADRDQSCFVCSALGEIAFLGTFACCVYLLQNIEAMFEIHGFSGGDNEADKQPIGGYGAEAYNEGDGDAESEPRLNAQEFYLLSEAGEGAMAWEATLQSLFPGCRTFWNRLLSDANTKLSAKMRQCFDMYYRPDNLSVIITGTLNNHTHILETLHEYHTDFNYTHPKALAFRPPWSLPLPPCGPATTSEIRFVSRNPNRAPSSSVCFGWRGTKSSEMETSLALKVLTAHLAVGPLWDQFVQSGLVHRITWCQLEYLETCDLITMHGIIGEENLEKVCNDTKKIIAEMADAGKQVIKLEDIRAMADRVGWHYVRELESDPFLMIAAAISKAERYGGGSTEYLQQRLQPRLVFDELLKKPMSYWQELLRGYFVDKTFATKLLPSKGGNNAELENPDTATANPPPQSEASEKQTFTATSRRASSRPRRRANPVGEESNVVDFNDGDGAKLVETEKAMKQLDIKEGHIEEFLKNSPFPFGDHVEDAKAFEERLKTTASFLDEVVESKLLSYPITSYKTDGPNQHQSFPVNEMPFYTFLEELDCSFVYATLILDTTHLDESNRKLIAPIVAALGAMLCPRPPGLDTDSEITNPCEFNPAKNISDSQVSLGLNGEMMQSIFITMIVRPENYAWLVGMFKFILYNYEFPVNFLKFISAEASKGLASNYRMQTAEVPNYHSFDSSEINMHSLVKMVYKDVSNARLFVGRRRLDLMNEYLEKMNQNPDEVGQTTNAGWRKIVDEGRIVLQIAGNISQMAVEQGDLVAPWKQFFAGIQKSRVFADVKPTLESEMMKTADGNGISVAINHCRPACFTTAIPINPNDKDFPKLCIAAQLFSMAQKWVWACMDEDDVPQPVLRMPCSYSNIMTLNLESHDVVGALEAMKRIMKEDWQWLNCMLIATKLMVVNDPSAVDQGPHGAIISALMSHLSGQPATRRRDILMETLKVNVDDVKTVIRDHLSKLFDPKSCWYALMAHGCDQTKLVDRLKEQGFVLDKKDLNELCTTL